MHAGRKPEKDKQMEQELTELFGETTYRLERSPCRGKYRGHFDYTLVFGSGRRLYIGLDKRNYTRGLTEQLEHIRHFRAHQQENDKWIKETVLQCSNLVTDVYTDIVPYDGTKDLAVYAAVILVMKNGAKLLYRTSTMHWFLVGMQAEWCSCESCLSHLLSDFGGKREYTRRIEPETGGEKSA